MDRLRTLLLARTATVVLDHDRVAEAATRPSRADDVERLEVELLQAGYVMSLDLALTVRRLPATMVHDLRGWLLGTLAHGARPAGRGGYRAHAIARLSASAEQPCPWCGELTRVSALDPCGHLVCRRCWTGGSFGGCPVCHRRIAVGDPFVAPEAIAAATAAGGQLGLLHLAIDVAATMRERFTRMLARTTALSADDRAELETVIDVFGPKVARWLPSRIPARDTMAVTVARLWLIAPDRDTMRAATEAHVATATDVLRIAVVLMGGDPALATHARLGSLDRGLRRAVLAALDRLDPRVTAEEIVRRRPLWQRVGERLHPFEHAARLPRAALAFAIARGTPLADGTLDDRLRAEAAAAGLTGDPVRVTRWGAAIEAALRDGDARAAIDRLADRPAVLLRRIDHVLRVATARQPDAVTHVVDQVVRALAHGAAAELLVLAAHLARRGAGPQPALPADATATVVAAIRGELLARAERRRAFARAVIDRALADRPAWPRRARPTLWELAALHVAARANVIYVRERDGQLACFRRRDGETPRARLDRLDAAQHDGVSARIPLAQAPTLLAVVRADLAVPAGSAGLVVDPTGAPPELKRLTIDDLLDL